MSLRRAGPVVCLLFAGALSLGMLPAAGSEPAPSAGVLALARLYPTPEALASFLKREVTFRGDPEIFGRRDYWQAPEEFLARRQGDCEDYALLTEAVLRHQGVEAFVFSLYGPGYAHTVCLFREGDRYHIFNQDNVIRCKAASIEEAAFFLCPRWTWGAVARRFGHRGRALRRTRSAEAPGAASSIRSQNAVAF